MVLTAMHVLSSLNEVIIHDPFEIMRETEEQPSNRICVLQAI